MTFIALFPKPSNSRHPPQIMRASTRLLFLFLAFLPPLLCQPLIPEDADVSGNTTHVESPSTNPASPQPPGLSALEQARSVVLTSPNPAVTIEDEDGGVHIMDHHPAADFARKAGRNVSAIETLPTSPSPIPPRPSCTDGICVSLGADLLEVIEGGSCRSVFVTGKCPILCSQGLAKVIGDENWRGCKDICGNDVVSGAAERWQDICGVRMETLIDQGKEAVKSLVGEGLSSRLQWKFVLEFLLGMLILVVGLGMGYRRGRRGGRMAQKRRLLGRKNSDLNLPL